MIRASIQPGPVYYGRSASYARLDPSEKGAVSFFLGQTQAKLFAHDFFRVSRFVHYDSYLAHIGRPRRRTRPDFIGFCGHQVSIGVEAKGRSAGYPRSLITTAKAQASSLPSIQGHQTTATYVHVAYFDHNSWCAHLEDPPRRRVSLIDPAALTTAYYLPIVNAIRARDPLMRSSDRSGASYLEAHFSEIDIHVSVRSDVAALTPFDSDVGSPDAGGESPSSLYQLALRIDSEALDGSQPGPSQDDFRRYLGSDGVAIELGPSWAAAGSESDE